MTHSDLKPTHPTMVPRRHFKATHSGLDLLSFSVSDLFFVFFFFSGFFPFSDVKGLFSDLVCLFVCFFLFISSGFFLFSDVKGLFYDMVCLFVCFFFFLFFLINRASETRL